MPGTRLLAGQRYVPRKIVGPDGKSVDIPDVAGETTIPTVLQRSSNMRQRKYPTFRQAQGEALESLAIPDRQSYQYANMFDASKDYVGAARTRIINSEIAEGLVLLSRKKNMYGVSGSSRLSEVARRALVGGSRGRLKTQYLSLIHI